jgi:hypothetical protein
MQRIILSFSVLLFAVMAFSQQPLQLTLVQRGEVIVSVDTSYLSQIPKTGSWSIDKQVNGKASIYLNAKQYRILVDLNIPFVQEPIPSLKEEFKMALQVSQAAGWDSYPDYDTYVAMMTQFAVNYPNLCKLDTIGETVEGRLLLALKISDNVQDNETEPEVFYTSSMHGDELTGYVLMLRLADYLLSNYAKPNIKELVDNLEIYINPLANPDGTFASGNTSVYGAKRFNSNNVDINRNFPDPKAGSHPDGEVWQPETQAMMEFMSNRNFSISMNFHGGYEVLNYPWDSISSNSDTRYRHADNDWFNLICREYADTAHTIDPLYMNDLTNGVTVGWVWYKITGGRQDYVTYFLHGREITAEISSVKLISANQLPQMWENNYRSLLNFLKQATYGIHGSVTDTSGNGLVAKISIAGHDKDSSQVWSQPSGEFYRYLKSGIYDLTFEANGFHPKTVSIAVTDFQKTSVEVQLDKLVGNKNRQAKPLVIFPNPTNGVLYIELNQVFSGQANVNVYSVEGKIAFSKTFSNESYNSLLGLDLTTLKNGVYFVDLEYMGMHDFARVVVQKE